MIIVQGFGGARVRLHLKVSILLRIIMGALFASIRSQVLT